ncbi:hypothetical protein [Persephonella sp.]|uniref:hypothetical protein n=1 Tax=Persephonella sp. TaxID=2060922 RepID=UPI0026111B77|nr:hypothetical protein [Persephonella sp.]
MGQVYNPNDFLCQICAYKSCLHKNKGRNIIRRKVLQMKKKSSNNVSIKEEKIFNFCKSAEEEK